MGYARIAGHSINAKASTDTGPSRYIISGLDAERFHLYCQQIGLAVSELAAQSFYVTHDTIANERAFPDSLNRIYVCNAIVEAAQSQGFSRGVGAA
jgi:hypothetical protein